MTARGIGFVTKQIAGYGRRDASRTRQDAAEVKYIFSMASSVLLDYLRQGCHVNLSDMGFALALTGKFPSAGAAADPSRNSVRVTVHAKSSFAKAVALSELDLVNMANPLTAHIFSVMDATLNVAGVISDASHVLITGEGLIVDSSAGDEGVWIVDACSAARTGGASGCSVLMPKMRN